MKYFVTIDEVKEICNLQDLKKTKAMEQKFPLIESLLASVTITNEFNLVIKGKAKPLVTASFKHAFSYFLLCESLDLMNTSTAGTGIIRSTGYNESRQELISQHETDRRQMKLELKAYISIETWLNDKGHKRLKDLLLWDTLSKVENETAKNIILNDGKKCRIKLV